MSKYYTPTIEEFHVGFEFEYLTLEDGEISWRQEIFCDKYSAVSSKYSLGVVIKRGCRVKYLDKEDIESLGFEKIEEPQSILEECYEKDGLVIQTNPFIHDKLPNKTRIGHRNKLRDGSGRYKGFYNYFQGTIKNKSELKKVLKMIGYE